MEHRCSTRVHVNAQVRLFRRRVPIGTGALINANAEGVFIAWHGRTFRRGTHLSLEILSDPPISTEPIPALVMHKSENGMGLLLHTPGVNLAELLEGRSEGPADTGNG